MMVKRQLIGFLFGVCIALFFSLLFALGTGLYKEGLFIFYHFMYYFRVSVLPLAVASAAVAYSADSPVYDTKKIWMIAMFFAFFTVALAGSIFSVIDNALRLGGIQYVNESGILIAGIVYATVLFPLTVPLAFTLILLLVFVARKIRS